MLARLVVAVVCALPVFTLPGTAAEAAPAAPVARADEAWPRPASTLVVKDPGLTAAEDMIVDEVNGRIFLSQGTDTMIVANLDGDAIASVTVAGATDLTTPEPGGTVFAASGADHQISAIDPVTLAVRPYPLGEDLCPGSIAVAAEIVWFVDECDGAPARLRGLDPDLGTVLPAGEEVRPPVRLVASHRAPGTVMALSSRTSIFSEPTTLSAYDAVDGATTLSRRARVVVPQEGPIGLAFTPDGSEVVGGGGARVPRFRVSDLARIGSHGHRDLDDGGNFSDAVAIDDDGQLAVAEASTVIGFYSPSSWWEHTRDSTDYLNMPSRARAADFAGDRFYVLARGADWPPRLHLFDVPTVPDAEPDHPLLGYLDVEVDARDGRIFVSQDGGPLTVTDLDGTTTDTLDLGYATSLTMSDDRSQLFVALPDSAALAVVDPVSLEVRRIALPNDVCPGAVAYASGRIWLGDLCADPRASLHVLDPVTGSLTRGVGRGGVYLISNPRQPTALVSCYVDPNAPSGTDVREMVVYEIVSDQELRERAARFTYFCREDRITLRTDGKPGLFYETTAWDLDMEHGVRIPRPGAEAAGAVAVRGDGLVVAARRIRNGLDDLGTYRFGREDPIATARIGETGEWITAIRVASGLAYVVVVSFPGPTRIRVLDPAASRSPPLRYYSRMWITRPERVVEGERFEAVVHLDSPVPGERVTLYRESTGGEPDQLVGTRRVDRRGRARFQVSVTYLWMNFTAYYAGNEGVLDAMASEFVKPENALSLRPVNHRGRDGPDYLFRATRPVRLAIASSPGSEMEYVRVHIQALTRHGWGRTRWSEYFRIDGQNPAEVNVRHEPFAPGRTFRFRLPWRSSSHYQASVTPWMRIRFLGSPQ